MDEKNKIRRHRHIEFQIVESKSMHICQFGRRNDGNNSTQMTTFIVRVERFFAANIQYFHEVRDVWAGL